MATIKSARMGRDGNLHFCEVALDGVQQPVTCRGASPGLARSKAAAYCKEHYSQNLTDGHFPKPPKAPKVNDAPPAATVEGDPAATGKPADPTGAESQPPPPPAPEKAPGKASAKAKKA